MKKRIIAMMIMVLAVAGIATGCGRDNENQDVENGQSSSIQSEASPSDGSVAAVNAGEGVDILNVTFGDSGDSFPMQLEENDTAKAIAGYVGTSDWRLPIYDRAEDVDYSVMEYYDIPSRYEIPSDPETVTEAKAGEVYYSDPNRIVLFYQDAEISEEYTKIGMFDATDEFISAVENNPVLEGWGNKIIQISR